MAYQILFMRWKNGEPHMFASQPVRDAFSKFGIENFGSPVHADLPGGLSVDLSTDSLNNDEAQDFSIEFRSVSVSLFQLVYELGRSVPLVAMVVDQPTLSLIFLESDAVHLPQGLRAEHDPVLCRSAKDVADAIAPGFDKWADWADFRHSE